MDLTGRYLIPASPQKLWDAIQDPAILKACIPNCESITKTSDDQFDVKAILKIGPLRARFAGRLVLTERDPPWRCILTGEGKGRLAGFAKGEAEVRLAPEGSNTLLSYTIRAVAGGKLARLAQRLIDGAAKRIADDFFARFAEKIMQIP